MAIFWQKIKWQQTEKQKEAWDYLTDQITTELLFGGGAGGAKSFLGCAWLISMCGQMAGSRWLMGRHELKSLKGTTLKTFFEVCKKWGLKKDRDFIYHEQKGLIIFSNTSEIILQDLKHMPSDPEYDFLGSLEITGAFVDEANQITIKCWEVIGVRERYKLEDFCGICFGPMTPSDLVREEYDETGNKIKVFLCKNCKQENTGLTKKTLGTCNPAKNWTYTQFYKKARDKKLPKHCQFVQALVKDNPFAPASYITSLQKIRDKNVKERLLHGNWEYDDDPSKLLEYDEIIDLFTNPVNPPEDAPQYLICDVARKGRDSTTISRWQGFKCKKIYRYSHNDRNEIPSFFIVNGKVYKGEYPKNKNSDQEIAIEEVTYFKNPNKWTRLELTRLSEKFQIPRSHILVDEDGVGGGLVDEMSGIKGFVNNSSAIQPIEADKDPEKKVNYANLKTQCSYEFANLAKEAKIKLCCQDEEIKEMIIEELGQIKQKDIDKDGKIQLIPKDQIKQNIGRSPDISDNLIMRMYFELRQINLFTPIFV